MKSFLITTLVFMASTTMFAIKPKTTVKTGAYGICNCETKQSVKQSVELLLNNDNTFHYTNSSNSAHPINKSGTWTRKGNKVVLTATDQKKAFHHTWKFRSNKKCIRSRYHLNFMRICLISPC